MIDCKDVKISVNPQDPLPTVSAERCSDIHLHFYEPTAMGSIYTVQCSKMFVHLQAPHTETNEIVLQDTDEKRQYVTKYTDDKIVTSLVIRGEIASSLLCVSV